MKTGFPGLTARGAGDTLRLAGTARQGAASGRRFPEGACHAYPPRITLGVAALAAAVLSLDPAPARAADPAAFERCVDIAVAHDPAETLSDFPALVRLGPSIDGFDYADFKLENGGDLRFLAEDGTVLAHEIDTWNPDGESLVWVKVPALSKGVKITCCYGHLQPDAMPGAASVWSKYVAVVHGGDAIENAVGNSVAATAGSTSVSATADSGIVGGGILKSTPNSKGVNLAKPWAALSSTGRFSVSGWFKRNGNGGSNNNGTHVLGASRAGWSNGTGYLWLQEQGKYISVAANGSHQWGSGKYKLADQTWGHAAFAYDKGVSLASYFDGAPDQTRANPGDLENLNGNYWTFGSYADTSSSDSFRGDMDELRIYDGVASAAWFAAEHATVADAAFLSYGAVYSPSGTDPLVSTPTATVGYTDATLSATVVRLGAGAAGGTATLELASDADFSTIVASETLAVTAAAQTISLSSANLDLVTTYYARATFVNDQDATCVSDTFVFTTVEPGPVFSVDVDDEHLAPVFSFAFAEVGYGDTIARLVIEASASGDFGSPDATKTLELNLSGSDLPASVADVVVSGLPAASSLHFRFTAVNAAGFRTVVEKSVATSLDGNNVWSGLSESVAEADAYVFAGGLPATGKTLYFTTPAGLSPVIDADTAMPSLRFTNGKDEAVDTTRKNGYHSCGYDFSGSGVLTFTSEKPILHATYGTNTISNPIRFSRTDNQSFLITSTGGTSARLVLDGDLLLPDGTSNTTMRISGQGYTVLGGASPDFMGQLNVEGGRLLFANPCAMTNVRSIYVSGDPTSMENATGAPLTFPRASTIRMERGWGGRKLHLYGAPFVFPQATFECAIRDYGQYAFHADFVVSNLVVRKNDSNSDAALYKSGTGAFIVTGETSWYDPSLKNYIMLRGGCFWPQTEAGLPPSGEFFADQGSNSYKPTLGLSADYAPMLDGSSMPRVFLSSASARFGFTAFGGDRVVCWNGNASLNLTNTTSGNVSVKISDTVSTNSLGKAYGDYFAYPAYFMFGNRSELADGTVRFQNPIRYELGQNWDTTTFFESSNHVVAARMDGSLKLGNRDRTWNFSGNDFGGYLALETDNADFTGKVNATAKGNLLVNSNLVAQSVTVQSGAGLGGTGSIETTDGTTVKAGGALFGGEWARGGALTLGGKVTLENGAALRTEIGPSTDRVGFVKLAPGSTLSHGATVYVDIDTDPRVSPVRGTGIKVLDWSDASFASGSAPDLSNFQVRTGKNPDLDKVWASIHDNALYVGYVSVRYPKNTILLLR